MNRAGRILLVDDDRGAIELMARVLAGLGELRFATGGADALRLARLEAPDLILLDADMPGLSGYQTCAALKADAELAEVPVIFVTGHAEPAQEVAGLEAGAADFIAKPINPPLLLARVRTQLRMKHLADELRTLAVTDPLTRVANRRRFDERGALECQRAERDGQPLALLLVDVDHFKRFNDRYGHPAGDAILQQVAQALAGCAQRPADLAARIGGEEFALLLPQADGAGAQVVAQRVLEAVRSLHIEHADSPTGPVLSASIGLACRAAGEALPALQAAADAALYAAKAGGRDRCVARTA